MAGFIRVETDDVLIDVTRLVDRTLKGLRPTGVDRVGLAYVGHYRQRARALLRFAGRWLTLTGQESNRLFDALLAPNHTTATRLRWLVGTRMVRVGRFPPPGGVLLNITHSGLEQAAYGERVRRYGLRPFYFLHDTIPMAYPEYARPGEADQHRRRLKTMLETGCGLIVNSAQTGATLESQAKATGYGVPPWVVAHLAPPVFPAAASARPMAESYFVMLSTIEPRKNHLLLLNLWREIVAQRGRAAPKLVMIGRRGWECEQVVDMLERCEVLKGQVIEIPDCDDAQLATWLHHAQALLFPSFAEGYGLPLIEALALGTPVIASDLPVFHELAGGIPDYLDPLDGPGWRQAVLDYASVNSPRRMAQKARMVGWQVPSWESHFEKVEDFIARVLA